MKIELQKDGKMVMWGIFHILHKITTLEEKQSYNGTLCNKDTTDFTQSATNYQGHKTNHLPLELKSLHWAAASWDLMQRSIEPNYSNTPLKYWILSFGSYFSIIYSLRNSKQIHLSDSKHVLIMLFQDYHAPWHALHVDDSNKKKNNQILKLNRYRRVNYVIFSRNFSFKEFSTTWHLFRIQVKS